MDKEFYCYVYVDTKNNKVRYVGKGFGVRAWKHKSTGTHNKKLHNTIVKRINEGYVMEPFIIPAVDEQHAHQIEQYLIKLFGREDQQAGPLFNLTDGGEGVTGLKHSDEQRRKMSERRQGKKASEVTKQKLSSILRGAPGRRRGKSWTAEQRETLSKAHRGKKYTPRTKPMSGERRDSISAQMKRIWAERKAAKQQVVEVDICK